MNDPVHDSGETSPFVGAQAWPPSLVARKPSPVLPIMGGIAVVILGVMVFLALGSGRQAATPSAATPPASVFAGPAAPSALPAGSAPAVTMPILRDQGAPPAALDQPVPAMPAAPAAIGAPVAPGAPATQRFHGPLVVVDMAAGGNPAPVAIAAASPAERAATPIGGNGGESGLAAQLGVGATSVAPTRMADTARIAPQGTVIPAVLETGINSDLPGFVRAIVGRDVRGYDGTTVLIPRGSRLIGQYRNAVAVGQSRAFVVWTRLITPAGLSLDIQSPGTDATGRSGVAGETHSHFFRRLGNAILLSVLNAALQAGANSVASPGTSIVIGSQAQASNVAALALQKEIDIPPTVIVNPGTPIRVFVARDLDFTGVPAK